MASNTQCQNHTAARVRTAGLLCKFQGGNKSMQGQFLYATCFKYLLLENDTISLDVVPDMPVTGHG